MERQVLLKELAVILQEEPAAMSPDFILTGANWDSVAVMSTIAMIDDITGLTVSGGALIECQTVSDVLALIEKAEQS